MKKKTIKLSLQSILFITLPLMLISAPAQAQVIIPGDPGNFITTWQTTAANENITIWVNPNATGYNYNVYWEDVNDTSSNGTETGATGDLTITFPNPGTYRVEIAGDFPALWQPGSQLLSVEQWGDIAWESMERAFMYASELEIHATDVPDLSGVTSTARMFLSATNFNEDLSDWDVSSVENMEEMFAGASSFNGDLSGWVPSSVTNMARMFRSASSFNQGLSSWDVSSVENMEEMFFIASSFNGDLSGWVPSSVTNMARMFRSASSFDQNLGGWHIAGVTNMSNMLDNSGLSTENYDATLTGWAAQSVSSGVELGAEGLTYCTSADARQQLIGDHNWTILGDSEQCEGEITPDENNILYVDINADTEADGYTGAGDSWANAVPELADALKWAREQHDGGNPGWDEANPLRIFVAKGEYKPLYDAADGQYTTDGTVANAFVLVPDVQLYGGFDPTNGIDGLDDDRILPGSNPGAATGSILSGDLDGDDGPDFANNDENVGHVVISSGDMASALLDGFFITGGHSRSGIGYSTVNGEQVVPYLGGGIHIRNASPTITNVVVNGNIADHGGGIYNNSASPVLTNVTLSGNAVGSNGGGIYINNNSSVLIANITITGNTAGVYGGGIFAESLNPVHFANIILWGNTADSDGNDLYNTASTVTLDHSLYRNRTGDIVVGSGSFTSTHSITSDPQFINAAAGDYSLQPGSPAINTGDNTAYIDTGGNLQNDTDLSGNPRVFDGSPDPDIIDMGAYEFQGEPQTDLDLTLTLREGWRMLASPINDDEFSYADMLEPLWTQGVPGSDYEGDENTFQNVYTWNLESPNTCLEGEPCPEWLPTDLTQTDPIPAGSGFLIYVFEDDNFDGTIDPDEEKFDKTLTLSGIRYTGDVSPEINDHGAGWTLVGNPYGQPVAFSALERTEVNDAGYIYDANADPNAVPDDGPTNGNGGAWRSTVSGLYGDITDGVIAPGQGFFVQTASGATNPSLTFSESDQTSGGEFYGKETKPRDYVRLEVRGESLYNSAWIRFSSEGSAERTDGEALELQPLSVNYAILGTRKADGMLMDIAHYPLNEQELEIPLAVAATQSGEFTIRATDLDLPAGMSLHLYDRQIGQSMPIGEDFEYRFDLDVEKITKNFPLKRGAKGGVSQAKNTTLTKDSPAAQAPKGQASRSTGAGGPAKAATSGTDRFLITTTPAALPSELPNEVVLGQNYPNPFNPATVIRYQLPVRSEVRLEVYDMVGRRVATLVDGQVAAGTHQVNFDAGSLSSGVYLYTLQAEGVALTRKLTLIK